MAGRIPQSFIDDLLDRNDIVEIIDKQVKLKKTGRNYSGLCPFHQEKTPSFSVNPDKQFYYCFGCGAGGNALSFLMEHDRLEFRTAIEDLARRVGMEIPVDQAENPEKARRQKTLYDKLLSAQQFFEQQLRNNIDKDRAVNYLKQRGLSGEIAKRYAVGFAPPGWDNLRSALADTDEAENQLTTSGMLIQKDEGGSYDRFRDRIMFPIRDTRGRTIAFGGRVLGDEKPKYLNSPESPVYHKSRELYGLYEARQLNSRLDNIIIVEGYMDVVALAQHGITNAVATLGTATSEAHLNKLFRLAPQLVFCFDGDEAGRKAALRGMETAMPLMQDGRQLRFLFLPEGEDPDTLVRQKGSDGFNGLLKEATSLSEYFFSEMCRTADLSSLDGKARLSKLALPLINHLPRGALYQLMLGQLGSLTGLEIDQLRTLSRDENSPPISSYEEETTSKRGSKQTKKTVQVSRSTGPAVEPLAARAISLLLQSPGLAMQLEQSLTDLQTLEHDDTELLVRLVERIRRKPDIKTAVLLSQWQAEPEFAELVRIAAKEPLLHNEESLSAEFAGIIQQLLDRDIDYAIERLYELFKNSTATKDQIAQFQRLVAQKNHIEPVLKQTDE